MFIELWDVCAVQYVKIQTVYKITHQVYKESGPTYLNVTITWRSPVIFIDDNTTANVWSASQGQEEFPDSEGTYVYQSIVNLYNCFMPKSSI